MHTEYGEGYFMKGKELGISNYENYTWMEERTMAFAHKLREHFGMFFTDDTFLDFGCARGYIVKALRRLRTQAWGYDISKWAIDNCDDEVKQFVSNVFATKLYDYILAKDVLEHIDEPELRSTVDRLLHITQKELLVIVPLSERPGGEYVREEDNKDATHVIKWPLQTWMEFFQQRATEKFQVMGSWHMPGLKPTSYSHLRSCGFISLLRVPR